MTDERQPRAANKKTPDDVSEFEREQLRFFLATGDIAATLASVNPSLAWLPDLYAMKLVQSETQLIAWIERNFADVDAVRDVVNNIRLFGPETANLLEFRLNNQARTLSPLVTKCWQLIIRHMRTAKQSLVQNEWFEISPQLKRGEHSTALLERFANSLRPKLKLDKRFSLSDRRVTEAEHPSDLMSIDYKVESGISSSDVLAIWPGSAAAETEEALLMQLTSALCSALADATDVGVESNEAFSTSDSDVPSVAQHQQNEYHSGFQVIVRVIVEIWTRLAAKSPPKAKAIAERWRDSDFRLMRRLALFAAADAVIPADFAADMLVRLPSAELYLFGSSVEIIRLIRARWKEFPKPKQNVILRRFRDGPPHSIFREGADIHRAVDHSRFEILSSMLRDGFDIGKAGKRLLAEITTRYPQWRPKPPEQVGFHTWNESGPREVAGEVDKLRNVVDRQLVAKAKETAGKADFMDGDIWQGLCLADPDRALRGLDAAAADGDWTVGFWEKLLWSLTAYGDPNTETRIAQLLLQWPAETFSKLSAASSSWLHNRVKTLPDDLLWPLWDKIADAVVIETPESESLRMREPFTDAINAPAGRLAEILLRKVTKEDTELSGGLRARFDKLVDASGRPGLLARVRLAADVPFLFARAPKWTKSRLLPLFEWKSPEAADVWSARKYSNAIGTPELFGLIKKPFLEVFSRQDVQPEDLRTFADWLVAILIVNQAQNAGYPLEPTEARAAMRRAGPTALSSVGHTLAVDMERAKPKDKANRWRKVIGPVFQAIWPLDVELQTSATTFQLVLLLQATGDAFPEAAAVIIPFIRPDEPHGHTTVSSIAEAPAELYKASPTKMLDLLTAIVGNAPPGSVYALSKALSRLRAIEPQLADTRKFQRLLNCAS
jgi:hypothetical protein